MRQNPQASPIPSVTVLLVGVDDCRSVVLMVWHTIAVRVYDKSLDATSARVDHVEVAGAADSYSKWRHKLAVARATGAEGEQERAMGRELLEASIACISHI